MKNTLKTIVIIFLYSLPSLAQGRSFVSAVRAPGKSYKIPMKKLREDLGDQQDQTPVGMAVPYNMWQAKSVLEWEGGGTIKQTFEHLRDSRFLQDPDVDGFLRRSSWMYPDDGCFARAELMNQNLKLWNQKPTNKIFVFGNLTVKTPNHPSGEVSWWYHVVPITRIGKEVFILDPAVESEHPLLLKDWLERMGPIEEMKMVTCSASTYEPNSVCEHGSQDMGDAALVDQKYFLMTERDRLKELGHNVDKELGDEPPWFTHNSKQKNLKATSFFH